MQILPEFIGCVAFLCNRDNDDRLRPGGTAFFVEIDDDTAKRGSPWTYLVTSAHSFDFISSDKLYVRLNTRPEVGAIKGFEDIEPKNADWSSHDSADVAAILSPADPTRHKFERIPIDTFINRDYRLDVSRFKGRGKPVMEQMLIENFPEGIGVEVGHDLYFPGLFVQSAGQKANLPIVRFGHIARMPGDELLNLSSPFRTMSIRGYLAESISWGGHSGSPVFWLYNYNVNIPIEVKEWVPPQSRLSIGRSRQPRTRPADVMIGIGWAQGLMGLVSGHYNIQTSKTTPRDQQEFEDIEKGVNAGIAIVTPAEHIRELLTRRDFVEDRKNRAEQIKEPSATADFLPPAKSCLRDDEIPPISRSAFFDALKTATRRKKPS